MMEYIFIIFDCFVFAGVGLYLIAGDFKGGSAITNFGIGVMLLIISIAEFMLVNIWRFA